MTGAGSATVLVVAGSGLFLLGAAIAVPRVFTEPDPDERLRLLQAAPGRWRAGQPLYALGALVAAAGVGVLSSRTAADGGRAWLTASCALLVAGALCWTWSVYERARHVREFALGELPGWSFAAYVWLTLAGLAALGTGLLVAGLPAWSGVLAWVGALGFLVVFVRAHDIPPFVFYLLLPVVSIGWL